MALNLKPTVAQLQAMREKRERTGCSLQEAFAEFEKVEIEKAIASACTVDDLRPILLHLLKKVY